MALRTDHCVQSVEASLLSVEHLPRSETRLLCIANQCQSWLGTYTRACTHRSCVHQEPVLVHRLQLFMPMGGDSIDAPGFTHTG